MRALRMEIDVIAYGIHLPPREGDIALDGPDHVAVIIQVRLGLPFLAILLVLLRAKAVAVHQ